MKPYTHKVNYYETDKMGITHHSNYIRWMEEARIDFLESIGFGYDKLEADGIASPVIGAECDYKKSTTFGDTVEIEATVESYTGVKLAILYTMKHAENGELVASGRTRHCFLGANGRPVSLKREYPKLDEKLKELMQK